MSIWRAAKLILTLHCEESARLQSDACERRLSFAERWAVRLHFLGCRACRHFRRQLQFIEKAARRHQATSEQMELPEAVREKIQNRLEEQS